jgi:hypothetical protein
MAMITRNTLVLRGVSVVFGGQTAWTRSGSGYRGRLGAKLFPISPRHPSLGSRGMNLPQMRHARADELGADQAALRAGRSDCFAGVPVVRSRSIRASLVSARSQRRLTRSLSTGSLSLPRAFRAGKRPMAKPACRSLAGRTRFAASTRGKV